MRLVLVLAGCALASLANAQPRVFEGGVRNAASYTPPGHLNSGLARGSLIVIFGEKLGPDRLEQAGYPLPLELGGTSVRVAAGGAGVDAPLVYASGGQIAAVLPSTAPLGPAQITVTAAGQTSAPVTIDVVQRNFGIFTLNQTGSGPAVVQNFETESRQPVNTLLAPARPGQVVTLWGTGLGPVEGPEAERPLPGDMNIPLVVRVGFRDAKVLYKGRSGCCPGVDQVVFEVPVGIEGCYAPVVVVAGQLNRQAVLLPAEGAVSNTGTIAIASEGRCRDALGLTGAELDQLASGAALKTAAIQVESRVSSATGSVQAGFARLDPASVLRSLNIFGLPPAGTCLEVNLGVSASAPQIAAPLDAGTLSLNGPRGTVALERRAPGFYAADLSQTLPAGTYSLENGSGGPDIGEFRASFTMPNPITWTNKSALLGGNQHTYQWTGGDADGYMVLTDLLSTRVASYGSICVERASTGQMTIPAPEWYEGLLEGRPFGPLTISATMSSVGPPVRFTARGLDFGVLLPKVSDQRDY